MDVMASTTGRFLCAAAALLDPNFRLTVVWILDHDDEGAFGLVVNRPSEIPVAEALPQWSALTTAPEHVFLGGPVGTDSAFALGRLGRDHALPGSIRPAPLGLCVVDLDGDPDDLRAVLEGFRVFAGYAGWGAGQLDDELEAGGWIVLDATADDVLSGDPASLWHELMRRAGGELARFANYPDSPWLN